MSFRIPLVGLFAGCALSALSSAALADPPGRVGRISLVEGPVSFQPPQDPIWTYAARNFPVLGGEAFWTGDQGRAEVEIGAMALRLDNDTELDVLGLDYGSTRLSLTQGSIDLRLWRVPRGGVSILTPAGEVRIDYAGLYRIDVGAAQADGYYPPVEVSVFDGAAGAPSPQGLMEVDPGEAALIYPGYAPQSVWAQDAAIDDWGRALEAQRRDQGPPPAFPTMTGIDDLAAYGQFQEVAGSGQVWFPQTVPADWQPYRFGRWAYVEPWGWTWIDDQPWGFAPFHYGRWARVGGRWGWFAGQPAAEPVYAPALVAFIGGGGWSVGFGSAGGGAAMGWVPLAPGEVYRPAYPVSAGYLRQVNVTNVSPITLNTVTVNVNINAIAVNQYRNAPAAVVVPAASFARGAPVQGAVMKVSAAALASAPLATAASRPAPTPSARAGSPVQAPGGAGRPSFTGGSAAAAPPPARLQAVRSALAAQPQGSLKPPVIPGAVVGPPRPRPIGAASAFIAPAQIRNPAAQARTPPPVAHAAPPVGGPGARSYPAARLAPPSTPSAPPPSAPPPSAPRPSAPRPSGAPPFAPPPFASQPFASQPFAPQPPAPKPLASKPPVPGALRPEGSATSRPLSRAGAAGTFGPARQDDGAAPVQGSEAGRPRPDVQAPAGVSGQAEAEAAARSQAAAAARRQAAALGAEGAASAQAAAAEQRRGAEQAQAQAQARSQAQAEAAARQEAARDAALKAQAQAQAQAQAKARAAAAAGSKEPKKKPPQERDRPPQ